MLSARRGPVQVKPVGQLRRVVPLGGLSGVWSLITKQPPWALPDPLSPAQNNHTCHWGHVRETSKKCTPAKL